MNAIPGMPRDDDGPVFREPWEAQAFAMTLALHERGLFTWPEWADTLAQEIKRAHAAGDPDTGETYYRHWLNALERLVAEKGVADASAAMSTPGSTPPAARRTASRSSSRPATSTERTRAQAPRCGTSAKSESRCPAHPDIIRRHVWNHAPRLPRQSQSPA
jgi:nitrile hydratase accessory protein